MMRLLKSQQTRLFSMPRNYTNEKLDSRLVEQVNLLSRKVREMKTFLSPNGYFAIPVRSSNPAVTKSGEFGLYYNTGTGKVLYSYSGSAWTNTAII